MQQLSMFEDESFSPNVKDARVSLKKIYFSIDRFYEQHDMKGDLMKTAKQFVAALADCKEVDIGKLRNYIRQHPHIAPFKNYLAVALSHQGNHKQSENLRYQIVEEHPDYIYGRLMFANILIEKGRLDESKQLLNKELNLRELFPKRTFFYVNEVFLFWLVCVNLMLKQDDLRKAQDYMVLMAEVDPNHPIMLQAHDNILNYMMEKTIGMIEEDGSQLKEVEGRSYDKTVQTDEKPQFNHPEVEELYRYGLDIDHGIINKLLNLPQKTLVQDLELVLTDTVRRYEYFSKKLQNKEQIDDRFLTFPFHALALLAYKESRKSLAAVMHLLRQGEELLWFWFGGLLLDVGEVFIAQLGKNDIKILKNYLKEENIGTTSKIVVSKGLVRLAMQYPGKEWEIAKIFDEVFKYFIADNKNDQLIDTHLITQMIWNCYYLNYSLLSNVISALYDCHMVETHILGNKKEVLEDINDPSIVQPYPYPLNYNIYAFYDGLSAVAANQSYEQSDPHNFDYEPFNYEYPSNSDIPLIDNNGPLSPDNHFDAIIDSFFMKPEAFVKDEEIGRNDPCPCGSGRKYKHCCME